MPQYQYLVDTKSTKHTKKPNNQTERVKTIISVTTARTISSRRSAFGLARLHHQRME